MALQLIEGFDHLLAANFTSKGWTANPVSVNAGRFGGLAARMTATASFIRKDTASPAATMICGFAMRGSSMIFNGNIFFNFYVAATTTIVGSLTCDASGHIRILNAAGGTVATGTTVLAANAWNFIEIKIFQNGASGTAEVYLNGVVEIASTTGNFGSTNIGRIGFSGLAANNTDFDDIYVVDTSGGSPRNTYFGDCRIETIRPNGDGAHTDWTPDSGTAHFSRVNETQADGDTSYVSDSTSGHLDTYTMDDLQTLSGTVFGLQTNLYARKDDVAARQIASVARQSGTDNVGATVTLASTYGTFSEIRAQDPAAADWTISSVNAMEFGVKDI